MLFPSVLASRLLHEHIPVVLEFCPSGNKDFDSGQWRHGGLGGLILLFFRFGDNPQAEIPGVS